MNLTIDSATIGYDVEGLKKVYTDIQTNLIDDAINTLKTNSQSLRNNVDTYWIGASAEAFKSKIDSDTDIVINRLLEIRSGLQNEIDQMMYNVNNSDVVLAENIRGKTVSISSGNSSGNKVNLTDQINGLANSNPMHSYHTNSNYATQVNQQTKSFDPALFATGATVALGFVEGVGQTAEAIVDTAAILGSGVASIFTGIYDGTNYLMGNETHVTSSMWNDTMGFTAKKYVSGAFDKMYEETKIGQAIKNNSWAFDTVRGVSNGIGYTAGVVALTVATAGAGGAVVGGSTGATYAATSITATQLASTAAVAGFGRGSEKAWNDGADLKEGLAYGIGSGIWEGAQFYAGAKINTSISSVGKRIALDGLTGAAEGVVQPGLSMTYKDDSYAKLFNDAGGLSNVAIQGAVGIASSSIGEVSGYAAINRSQVNSREAFINGVGQFKHSQDAILRNAELTKTTDYMALSNDISLKNHTLQEYGSLRIDNPKAKQLQAVGDSLAEITYNKAVKAEPAITAKMQELELNGLGKLTGLDHRLKGKGSLSRKIISDSIDDNIELSAAANNIGDSVRYTLLCDEKTMANDVSTALNKLQNDGYTVRKFSNTFDSPSYKGINTGVVAPDGTRFELQFHTAQSFSVKEETNHVFYEISRNKSYSSKKQISLSNRIMENAAKDVVIPKGVLDLTADQFVNN